MSYLYGASPSAYPPPAGGVQATNYGAPPPTASSNAYPHSPYAVQAAAPHSPYVGAGQPQPPAGAYPHSPYASSAGSTTHAPTTPGGYPNATSPMVGGQMYLPPGAQLTVGSGMTSPTMSAQQSQPFTSNVQPGAVTYTTTTDAQGRITYHHFKAEPSTYKSPQGVTYTGIQWVPTETSFHPPVGIPPAGPDVIASFRGQFPAAPGANTQFGTASVMPGLGPDYRDDAFKSPRELEKEEKRRRKEEKRRNAAWEAERIAREKAEDKEMRKAARERDAELDRAARMRRPSYGAGLGAGLGAGAYDRERSRERSSDLLREREFRDREERELERRMGDLDVGGRGSGFGGGDYEAGYVPPAAPGTRSRRQSVSARVAPAAGIYDDPQYDRDDDEYPTYGKRDASRHRSGIYAAPERSRPSSIYGPPERERAGRPTSMYGARDRSPYRRDASPLPPSLGPGGVEVYPPGHIYAGQPVTGSSSGFGAGGLGGASPRLGMGGGLSPRVGGGAIPGVSPRIGGRAALAGGGGYGASPSDLLSAPDAFSRPINSAHTFTPFKDIRIQSMDCFLEHLLFPMPAVLGTHDVLSEDWGRLMNDLKLAWQNRLPLPADKPTRRSDLVIDLLDLWNSAFFIPRCVELVLYKGRNQKSGRGANNPDTRLAPEELVSSDSDDDDDETDDSEEEGGYGGQYDSYGRQGHASRREMARAARQKVKMERKVQREIERNKRYALWLRYVDPRSI
ncbi:uncharacterized protein FOMMEDRAFT_169100 [Fomitiporia mediterranea MF3/22]|uniref:uncharacterized protein n=1 Tax=Fomitiporia mediterranea (strain MF3/22) TaxID=694068 RepID=UPI0004407C7D|nr:uncharacterized protein FOMMEDRAFT_169100 [Fomitiporia mediterranea MF3/22]EJD00871.1 hypothetical protein FOMMEDRAFT_169100 [Fomitiporia mediterranea MF3/22]